MNNPPTTGRGSRLALVIDLLRERPLPAEVLLVRFNRQVPKSQTISLRTLQHDLEWLQEHLGPTVIARVNRQDLPEEPPLEFHRHRQFYRLVAGEDLIPVEGEVAFVSELEALALAAARAQLTIAPTPGAKGGDEGPLAAALGRLVHRLGLKPQDPRVPDVLAVTQSPPQAYDPQHALTVLRAIRLGEGITMQYAPLNKPAHSVTAQPIRVVLVDGEPHLWAWDGQARKVKNYKMARMVFVERRDALTGVPIGLDGDVKATLSGSFRGVAGQGQRGRVVLRVSPHGVPHLRHRRLGGAQEWIDLPDGGARVSFNTSGLEAVRHYLLQFGSQVVVEGPAELAAWMRAEADRMLTGYGPP